MYDRVDSFTVCQPTPFSDHSPVKGWFKIFPPTNNSFPEMTGIELNDLPKQFQWNFLSSERFINALSSKDIQEMIQDFETEHFISYDKKVVHNVVPRFNNIIETVAKRSLQIGVRKNPRKTPRRNHAWFDKECKIFQKHVKRMSNLKHRNPHNTDIRDNYHNLTKKSKALLRTKQQCYFNDKLNLLTSGSNPKSFWDTLKTLKKDHNPEINNPIPVDKLYDHFSTLHSNPKP